MDTDTIYLRELLQKNPIRNRKIMFPLYECKNGYAISAPNLQNTLYI